MGLGIQYHAIYLHHEVAINEVHCGAERRIRTYRQLVVQVAKLPPHSALCIFVIGFLTSVSGPRMEAGPHMGTCLFRSDTTRSCSPYLYCGYAPRGTSGRHTLRQEAKRLNSSGMYSLLRHPLYLGNALMWLGISLFVHVWWVVVISMLIFWIYYERIMFAEEEFYCNNLATSSRYGRKKPLHFSRNSKTGYPLTRILMEKDPQV